MKSIMSWLVLIVSITLLVSSCSTEDSSDQNFSDDSTRPQVMKVQVPLMILIRPSWSWSQPKMKVPGVTAPTVGTRSIQATTKMQTKSFKPLKLLSLFMYVMEPQVAYQACPILLVHQPQQALRVRHIVSHQRLQKPQVIT